MESVKTSRRRRCDDEFPGHRSKVLVLASELKLPLSPPSSQLCIPPFSPTPLQHEPLKILRVTPTKVQVWIRAREAEATNAGHPGFTAIRKRNKLKKEKRLEIPERPRARSEAAYPTPPPSSPSRSSGKITSPWPLNSATPPTSSRTGRDMQPPLRHPREFLLYHGKLGQDQPPHRKIQLRLQYSETPVVDLLLGPALQIRYDRKQRIIERIIRGVGKRKAVAIEWHDIFSISSSHGVTSQPPFPFLHPGSPPVPVTSNLTRHRPKPPKYYDYTSCSSSRGLQCHLASTFGLLPFDPVVARRHMEDRLKPLVIANRSRFIELKLCHFWRQWSGRQVMLEEGKTWVL